MKKAIMACALAILLASCTSTSHLNYKVNEFKETEEMTKRGPITVGPLAAVPEATVKSVINEIDAGNCTPSQNVIIRVDTTSIMGFAYKKEATFKCK